MKLNRNIIKLFCFILGLVLILQGLSFAFERREGIYMYDAVAVRNMSNKLDKEADNSLDILFLGDSECYSSFSPLHLFSEYGYTSFVCGTSAQRICDTYAILEAAFKTQSPKVIILEVNCLYRGITEDEDDSDKALRYLTNKFAVFANHSDWKRVAGKMAVSRNSINNEMLKGFQVRRSIIPYIGGQYMYETDMVNEIGADIDEYVDKIEELCKENEASLILVSTPSPRNWSYEKHNGIAKVASRLNLCYLDLNLEDSIDIDWLNDTKDGGDHLNFGGAVKVTMYLGEYIGENYLLTDYRDNPEYQSWKDCMAAIK